MTLRPALIVIHRWLALIAGLVFAIAAVSGSVLVFERELAHALNAGRFDSTASGSHAAGALDLALAEHFAGQTIVEVLWPTDHNVYTVVVQDRGGAREIYLDGRSAAVIEPLRPANRWLDALRSLHANLFLGRLGSYLTTLMAAATFGSLLTGIVLWWPGLRRLAEGFTIRLQRGLFVGMYDIHRVTGAAAFAILLIMSGTGVLMGAPGLSSRLARVAVAVPASPRPLPQTVDSQLDASPTIESMAARAERATGQRIRTMAFPTDNRRPIEAIVWDTDPINPTYVHFSRADGRMSGIVWPDQRSSELRFGILLDTWHMGRFPSNLARAVFALASALGGVIVISGYVVWWQKRVRRFESASRAAASRS